MPCHVTGLPACRLPARPASVLLPSSACPMLDRWPIPPQLTRIATPHAHTGACRYEHGQQYAAHWDVNDSPERLELMRRRGVLGGMRTATLLMYLSGEQGSAVRCSTVSVLCGTAHVCCLPTAVKRQLLCRATSYKPPAGVAFPLDGTQPLLLLTQTWRRAVKPLSPTGNGWMRRRRRSPLTASAGPKGWASSLARAMLSSSSPSTPTVGGRGGLGCGFVAAAGAAGAAGAA
jgi:hypothetical protein